MNFRHGNHLARIKNSGLKLNKMLKYDNGNNNNNLTEAEELERFGKVNDMKCIYDKVMQFDDDVLYELLETDPKIKEIVKQGMNNHKNIPNALSVREIPGKDIYKYEIETNNDYRFIPTIDPLTFREIVYIYGASGCGKSVLCRSYVEEYKHEFPFNDVYLFSLKESDVTLSGLPIKRIENNIDILGSIDIETLKNSLVIFDDCDGYDDKSCSPEQKEIYRIQDNIAQFGRDRRISCIVTTHLACKGKRTKIILNECHKIISFPGKVAWKQLEYLMTNYGGLNKKEYEHLCNIKSRWVCVNKCDPMYILYETGIKMK